MSAIGEALAELGGFAFMCLGVAVLWAIGEAISAWARR